MAMIIGNEDYIELMDIDEENQVELMEIDDSDSEVDSIIDSESICKMFETVAYADIEGFKAQRGRFICKEICVINNDNYYHAIVKPPFNFKYLNEFYQRHASWWCRNYHRLTFDCGDTHINKATEKAFMMLMNKKVLVKNAQKAEWFRYIFRHCGSIDFIPIDKMELNKTMAPNEMFEICEYHNRVFGWSEAHCCLSDALKLRKIAIQNIDTIKCELNLTC